MLIAAPALAGPPTAPRQRAAAYALGQIVKVTGRIQTLSIYSTDPQGDQEIKTGPYLVFDQPISVSNIPGSEGKPTSLYKVSIAAAGCFLLPPTSTRNRVVATGILFEIPGDQGPPWLFFGRPAEIAFDLFATKTLR